MKDYQWDSNLDITIPILSFLPHQVVYPMFQKEPLSHSFFDNELDFPKIEEQGENEKFNSEKLSKYYLIQVLKANILRKHNISVNMS